MASFPQFRLILPVLMALLAPVAAPAFAGPVTAQHCEALRGNAGEALAGAGLDFAATFTGVQEGGCAFSGLEIRGQGRFSTAFFAETVLIHGTVLTWPGEGRLPSSDLVIAAAGMRFAPQTGDARTDYIFQTQARAGEMSLDLRASWDEKKKEVLIDGFDLRLGPESRIRLTALAKNVDLSTPGAAQMALTGAAVTSLDLDVNSFGLFEHFLLPLFVEMIPYSDQDADFASLVAERKLALRAAINDLPDASFPAPSRAALAALLSDLPNPRGKLVVGMRSENGFGPARFTRYALTGWPQTVKEAAPLFNDTRFTIEWRRGDRS